MGLTTGGHTGGHKGTGRSLSPPPHSRRAQGSSVSTRSRSLDDDDDRRFQSGSGPSRHGHSFMLGGLPKPKKTASKTERDPNFSIDRVDVNPAGSSSSLLSAALGQDIPSGEEERKKQADNQNADVDNMQAFDALLRSVREAKAEEEKAAEAEQKAAEAKAEESAETAPKETRRYVSFAVSMVENNFIPEEATLSAEEKRDCHYTGEELARFKCEYNKEMQNTANPVEQERGSTDQRDAAAISQAGRVAPQFPYDGNDIDDLDFWDSSSDGEGTLGQKPARRRVTFRDELPEAAPLEEQVVIIPSHRDLTDAEHSAIHRSRAEKDATLRELREQYKNICGFYPETLGSGDVKILIGFEAAFEEALKNDEALEQNHT